MSLTDADINRYVTGFFNNMERYKNAIKTQFERGSVDGRSFQRSRVQDRRTDPPPIPFTPIPAEPRLLPPVRVPRIHQRRVQQEHPPAQVEPDADEGQELNFEELSNEFPELLDCFSTDGFDPRCFERFAEHFLRHLAERADLNPQDVEKNKDCLRSGSKPLHHVHAVQGPNESDHVLLEGNDRLSLSGGRGCYKEDPSELLELCQTSTEKI